MFQWLKSWPATLCLGYVALAIAALPFILFGLGFHVSGFDCADASWSDNVTLSERDAVYRNLGRNVRVALVLVAALAAVPLGMAMNRSRERGIGGWLVGAFATAVLWLIYGLAFFASLSVFTCGSQTL